LNLITNADRMASPDSPDAIPVEMALDHIGASRLIKHIDIQIPHYGWYPESKCGYLYYEDWHKDIILCSKKRLKIKQIIYFPVRNFLVFQKATFIQFISLINEKSKCPWTYYPDSVFFTKRLQKFFTDALDQAEAYLPKVQKYGLKYPAVFWHPKLRAGEKYSYKDGLVIIKRETFDQYCSDHRVML
jgi:hypothetical protein